jgi:magnesium transporter
MVNFIYLSELLDRPIVDINGVHVGALKDVVLAPTGEKFPEIESIVLKNGGGRLSKIGWKQINRFDKSITLGCEKGALKMAPVTHKDILLVKYLLDQQIVDIDGLKVVRVNDVVLSEVGGKFCVVSIDVGTKGLLRRLGIEWFASIGGLKEQLLPWGVTEPLQPKLRQLKLKIPRHQLSDMHPADIATVVTELSAYEREVLLKNMDPEKTADTLTKMDSRARAAFFSELEDPRAAEIFKELPPDDAADLLSAMSPERTKTIISLMEEDLALKITDLLKYKERSVGSIMTTDFFKVAPESTAKEVLRLIRRHPDTKVFYHIYLTDKEGKLKGVVSLRRLLLARPKQKVSELVKSGRVVRVNIHANKAKAAKLMAKYDLLTIAVVDSRGKLKGVIIADDALGAILPPRISGSLPHFFSEV